MAWALGVSLLANAAIGVLWMRSTNREPVQEPGAGQTSEAVGTLPRTFTPTPLSAADPVLPRELRSYAALGTFVAENNKIPALRWSPEQFEAFQVGLRSSYEGRGFVVDEDAVKLREEINARVQSMLGESQANPVEEYFTTLREKEGVLQLPSGLHYRITEDGNGEMPNADSTILLSYTARLPGGQSLAALSRLRVRTRVSDLLQGMAEGVQLLKPGGKALVYLPPELSFKEGPWPAGVPEGAPIIFFVELHEVTEE